MRKIFLLGLGGQKCASTWYQDYIARQPGSDFGQLKEYRAWQCDLSTYPFADRKVNNLSFSKKVIEYVKWNLGRSVSNAYVRSRLYNSDEYFKYFANLLSKDNVVRSGDVSPLYSMLGTETLMKIQHGFNRYNIQTRAIFSMRDPVSRIRSHFNMALEKKRVISSGNLSKDLQKYYLTDHCRAYTRYDLTIKRLETAFSEENIHLCLFEELTSNKGIISFSKFANIDIDEHAVKQKINARNSSAITIPESLEKEIALYYQPVYKSVYQKFPQIKELWPSAKYINL